MATAWKLDGNSLERQPAGFLGTIDKKPLIIKVNRVECLRVAPGGAVGIGTPSPRSKLEVNTTDWDRPALVLCGNGRIWGACLQFQEPESPPYYITAMKGELLVGVGNPEIPTLHIRPNALQIDGWGHNELTPITLRTITGTGDVDWELRTSVPDATGVGSAAFEVWTMPANQPRLRIEDNGDTTLAPSGGSVLICGGLLQIESPSKGVHKNSASLVLTHGSFHWTLQTKLPDDALEIWELPSNQPRLRILPGGDTHLTPAGGNVIVKNNNDVESIRLDGNAGDVILRNADLAEEFDMAELSQIEPGMVVVLDETGRLCPGEVPYDCRVVGVISNAGSHKPGIVLDKKPEQPNRLPVALGGKVYCKVDADRSPIRVGDLLTTSPTLGHAMKATEPLRAFGAVVGKALAPLGGGRGLIPVLIALQ